MYSLIIVDYNSIEATANYIAHCRQYLGVAGASHVVIIENGSTAGVEEFLASRFGDGSIKALSELGRDVVCYKADGQEIVYCPSGGNLGYARGNNLGAEIARTLWNDPYYIISNNDLVLSSGLDLSLAEELFSQNPEIGVIGPLVVTPAGVQQSPRRWLRASACLFSGLWLSAFGGLLGEKQRQRLWDKTGNDVVPDAQSGYCDWVSGCFMLVRAAAFHKAGMFDPHTFLYAEEPILAKRLEAVGSRVYFCRELSVIHRHAESTKKAIAAFRMVEIGFDANCYFYKTYMHTSPLALCFYKISFRIFKLLYLLKHRLAEK